MAGFPYVSMLDSIVSVLSAANTTTSTPNLSLSMTTKVQYIDDDDPETVNIGTLKLPAVFVRIESKDEGFGSIGDTGPTGRKKDGDIEFDIIGIVRKNGLLNTHANLKRDAYTLAQNIEAVIQANITLSGTVLWCNPKSTDFSLPVEFNDGTWMKACRVRLTARAMYR